MLRWVIGDFYTGRIRADITQAVVSGSWAEQLNAAAPITAEVNADAYFDTRTGLRSLDLRGLTTPWRAYLGCIDTSNSRVLGAGPISSRPWDDGGRTVSLTAAGFWSYLFRRVVIPAYTSGRIDKLVTKFTAADGLALPDIAVQLMLQMRSHPGGAVPLVIPTNRIGGDSERQYDGADAAYYGDRMKELVEVDGGPDIMFQPYLADDTHIRWRMVTGGDESNPFISAKGKQRFEYSAPENGITGLQVDEDSTNMVGRAFSVSGTSEDDVLAGQNNDTYLVRNGWPLLEHSESRQSVTRIATLDRYAKAMTAAGRKPVETWTMSFARNERPYLDSYWVGDFAQLNIVHHPWIADGLYETRIVGLKGDLANEKVDVTFMEGVVVETTPAVTEGSS